MFEPKKASFLVLIAILALVGALAVAGCGGSGGTTTEETTKEEEPAEESGGAGEEAEEEPAEEAESEPAEEEEAGGVETAGGEGETIFTTNCASCHTLAAAGTTGTVGPNLDELEPSESIVEHQVINGGGPMPAFGKEEILSPTEVKEVAEYVSSVAGKE